MSLSKTLLIFLLYMYDNFQILCENYGKKQNGSYAQASIEQYPFIALIFEPCECGGTLIQPYFVVTSAHCVLQNKTEVGVLKIFMGGALTNTLRQIRESEVVHVYPGYSEDTYFHDIALIRMLNPFQLNEAIDVARLPKHNVDFEGVRVVKVDWIPKMTTKRLIKNDFSLVASTVKVGKCEEVVGRTALICADESLGLECDVLVGGALVYRKMVLIGISTEYLGRDCGKPTCYETISKYVKWMENRVGFRSGSSSRLMPSCFSLTVAFLIIKH